jgi:hypothetical protein
MWCRAAAFFSASGGTLSQFLGKWRNTFAGSSDGKMNQISLRSEHPI